MLDVSLTGIEITRCIERCFTALTLEPMQIPVTNEIPQYYCPDVVKLLSSPQDVLATLLNNLKVQERQNRVCTTVAIAIVAETCSPFTVLPALMNEYRVPELNVQNGVLKSLSFLFEYIGEMGKDYIYAVTPLLEDALMDRLDNELTFHYIHNTGVTVG